MTTSVLSLPAAAPIQPGSRVFRIQLGDMTDGDVTETPAATEPPSDGINTPQSGDSDPLPSSEANMSLGNAAEAAEATEAVDVPNSIYRQAPDEKLLEAMQSPRDRLFLLRLEKDVMDFVQLSKEPYMDLPPCNAFCRLLIHKLADYYHMTHSYEQATSSVRIFRTPFCRVPPSLNSIVAATANGGTPPPVVQPRKIMRRGEDGESAVSSAGPSKPTSEAGSENKEKPEPVKAKLSREEREEQYQRARERIFGSSEKTGESTPENGDATGVSRASSVSGGDRSNQGKRGKNGKQRRDDHESFDSRSQYTPFYANPHQPTWAPQPQYAPVGMQPFNGQLPQPYQVPMGRGFGPNTMTYPPQPQMMPAGMHMPYNGMPQVPSFGMGPHPPGNGPNGAHFPPQQPPPRYPQLPVHQVPPPYGPPIHPPPPHQGWQGGYNSGGPFAPRAPVPGPTSAGIPYAYGQLPANMDPNDPRSQHPIPGSFNRHAFHGRTH